jgi:hypothetical protein
MVTHLHGTLVNVNKSMTQLILTTEGGVAVLSWYQIWIISGVSKCKGIQGFNRRQAEAVGTAVRKEGAESHAQLDLAW